MNDTYELEDEQIKVINQPIGSSTPEKDEGVLSKSRKDRVRFEDVSPPESPFSGLGLIVLPKEKLVGLTPRRVHVKGTSLEPPKSSFDSPQQRLVDLTKEEREKAGLTPRRVPVKGHPVEVPKSVPESSLRQSFAWTKEVLEKTGVTPRRVPLKARALEAEKLSFDSPCPSTFSKREELELVKVGATSSRVPVIDQASELLNLSFNSPRPSMAWPREELSKSGMTPRRVLVRKNRETKEKR